MAEIIIRILTNMKASINLLAVFGPLVLGDKGMWTQ